MIVEKDCNRCGEWKPMGLMRHDRNRCKACHSVVTMERAQAKLLAMGEGKGKVCVSCRQAREMARFITSAGNERNKCDMCYVAQMKWKDEQARKTKEAREERGPVVADCPLRVLPAFGLGPLRPMIACPMPEAA